MCYRKIEKAITMNHKIKLLAMGARKASLEKDFMSFVLNKYLEIEKIPETELISLLGCSKEDFYKLALCKAPDIAGKDFIERVRTISEYSRVPILELNKIIKRVDAISKLSTTESYNSFLMAARDKKRDEPKN